MMSERTANGAAGRLTGKRVGGYLALATGAALLATTTTGAAAPLEGFADVAERAESAVVSVKVYGGRGGRGERVERGERWEGGGRWEGGERRGFRGGNFGEGRGEQRGRRWERERGEHRGWGGRGREHGFGGFRFRGRGKEESQGSGFFVSADGYVATNWHVVRGVERGGFIEVKTASGKTLEARLAGADRRTDLALLKVVGEGYDYMSFADKPEGEEVRVGDWVVAVGSPFGLGGTVTAGVVSARGRRIGAGLYDDFIQMDASINPGSSGGPVLNVEGEVVGVSAAIVSPTRTNVGIGFAIPAAVAERVLGDLREYGEVRRGWLGVRIQGLDDDMASALGMEEARGALILRLASGGPASLAGLKEGDVVLWLNGEDVGDPGELARLVSMTRPGDELRLRLLRGGEELELEATSGLFPPDRRGRVDGVRRSFSDTGEELEAYGMKLADAGGEGLRVASVEAGSEAARKGLRAGDRVLSIGGREATDLGEALEALEEARRDERAVLLKIRVREGGIRYTALKG